MARRLEHGGHTWEGHPGHSGILRGVVGSRRVSDDEAVIGWMEVTILEGRFHDAQLTDDGLAAALQLVIDSQ